ncbi:hypothetical protein IL306_003329 [Fusarium sp. DS 682]|nr:hypothetical protein IL306_003329 [Fusarium sp. DS 682]
MESVTHASFSNSIMYCIGGKIEQAARLFNATLDGCDYAAAGFVKFVDGDMLYQDGYVNQRGSCTVSVLRGRSIPGHPSTNYPEEDKVEAVLQVDQLDFQTPLGQLVNANSFIELDIQDIYSAYPSATFRIYCHELSAMVEKARFQEALINGSVN